jgi:hypothetical protein
MPQIVCRGAGRDIDVIFVNKRFAALRLSNAEAGGCRFFGKLFNTRADRTILLPWSSRTPAIRQLIYGG